MSVKVKIDPFLRQFTGGREVVESKGQTVAECIKELENKFPGIKQQLWDKQGKLLNHIGIWVNSEILYTEGLPKPIKDGDELLILTILDGG